MKYKEGDRVRIKSLDWHNKNKSKSHGTVACGGKYFDYDMREWCGKTMTILTAYQTCYIMREDGAKDLWTDEMIEGLVEEEIKPKFNVGDKITNGEITFTILTLSSDRYGAEDTFGECGSVCFKSQDEWKLVEEETKPKYEDEVNGEYYSTPKYLVRPSGYQFVDENGNVIEAKKIVLEKKKKEYPKTYEECCQYLGCDDKIPLKIIGEFTKLINARNAYWKMAGEEMGLGKPWEPDYTEESYEQGCPIKYVIYYTGTHITKERKCTPSYILTFPTEEMRDIFYENFKEEIEICKELL